MRRELALKIIESLGFNLNEGMFGFWFCLFVVVFNFFLETH